MAKQSDAKTENLMKRGEPEMDKGLREEIFHILNEYTDCNYQVLKGISLQELTERIAVKVQAHCEKRVREEAGLTDDGILAVKCKDPAKLLDETDLALADKIDVLKARVKALLRATAKAQLNKALSTEIDGRYRLGIIDTKGELPKKPDFYSDDLGEAGEWGYDYALKNMQGNGFTHRVVHVFGEKE